MFRLCEIFDFCNSLVRERASRVGVASRGSGGDIIAIDIKGEKLWLILGLHVTGQRLAESKRKKNYIRERL